MQESVILTGEEFYDKQKVLKLVKQLNWENFYIDERTGEKWLEEYPNSRLHGGGPPRLRLVEKFPWDE